MRFLVEVELCTAVPVTVEADTAEDALKALLSARESEYLSGDPVPKPPVVKRIKALGE